MKKSRPVSRPVPAVLQVPGNNNGLSHVTVEELYDQSEDGPILCALSLAQRRGIDIGSSAVNDESDLSDTEWERWGDLGFRATQEPGQQPWGLADWQSCEDQSV